MEIAKEEINAAKSAAEEQSRRVVLCNGELSRGIVAIVLLGVLVTSNNRNAALQIRSEQRKMSLQPSSTLRRHLPWQQKPEKPLLGSMQPHSSQKRSAQNQNHTNKVYFAVPLDSQQYTMIQTTYAFCNIKFL